MKLRGDAALEQDVARLVETELSRGQVEFFLLFVFTHDHFFLLQLTAFLCHCDEDRRELVKILDEVYGQVAIH